MKTGLIGLTPLQTQLRWQRNREHEHMQLGLTALIEAVSQGAKHIETVAKIYTDLAANLRAQDAPAFLINDIQKAADDLKKASVEFEQASVSARLCLP